MATRDDRLAAAKQALSAIGVTDDQEAERFVAMFEAVFDLDRVTQDATVITMLSSNDPELQARIKTLRSETLELARDIITSPGPGGDV
jgi:hypothetical protein